MGYPFWKAVWQYVSSLVFLPFDPVSPLLGSHRKGKRRNVDKHLQRAGAVLTRPREEQQLRKLQYKI